MGTHADDILSGLVDGVSGEYIDGTAPGFPRSVRDACPKDRAKYERRLRYEAKGQQERPTGQSAAGVIMQQIKAAGGSMEIEAVRIPWVHNNQVPAVVLGLVRRGRVEIVGSIVRAITEKGV